MAGLPTAWHTRFDAQPLRVLLLLRLWLRLPSSDRNCQCGLPVDSRTTVQPAQLRGFWDGGDLQWKVRRHASVEKQAPGSLSMSGPRTWISPVWTFWTDRRLEIVADGLPLFLGGAIGRLHDTRVGAEARCIHSREVLPQVVRFWRQFDVERKPLTPSSPARTNLVVLGCEVGGGGRRKPGCSSAGWPRQRSAQLRVRARQAWRPELGNHVGVQRSQGSRTFFAGVSGGAWLPMAPRLPPLR